MTTASQAPVYRGRFAPSPTGPLHFGSLVAAVGSYLEARRHGGQWLLRIEDLDSPRNAPGATDCLLRTLERFGLEWDGPHVRQSVRTDLYAAALDVLRLKGLVYPCGCTRREVADSNIASRKARTGPGIYPGTCRTGLAPGRAARALRIRVERGLVCFDDMLQGRYCQDVAREVGDFILVRADAQIAYQLAVVVDDAEQRVTHVVRGADLLESTPRQLLLCELLGYTPERQYLHLPVATNAAGEKLSKQTRAASLEAVQAPLALAATLQFLGQQPPAELGLLRLSAVWEWARANWRLDKVPRAWALQAPAGFRQSIEGESRDDR